MSDEVAITVTSGSDPRVAALVAAYGRELVARAPWIAEHVRRWDVGAEDFSIATVGGADVGCVALSPLSGSTVELRRMFVSPAARRSGIGRALLRSAEQRAAGLGFTRIVLDTMSVLTEAVTLYRACGYVEIDAYNDNPAADLWFEKHLRCDSGRAAP